MEISRHVAFRVDTHPELFQFAVDNKLLPPDVPKPIPLVSFDIYESNPLWPTVEQYILAHEVFCYAESSFSDEELHSAQWMSVFCRWRNGYPQPEDNLKYQTITYSSEALCKECGTGLVQIAPFRMRKAPVWKNRHFMSLNWVEDERFVDQVAKDVLQASELEGISFCEVLNTKGTEVLEGVYQLVIPTWEREGVIEQQMALDDVNCCPCCGIKQYYTTGRGPLQYKQHTFDGAPDAFKTREVFGRGYSPPHKIIISQRMYQVLTQNKLDRGLVFTPIEFV